MDPTATLFDYDVDRPSEAIKLVRLVRDFRGIAMTNTDVHIEVVGRVSRNSLATATVDDVIRRMVKWCQDVRDA